MDDGFREMVEAIKRAHASLHAHEEHEDLRETVRRLEVLVIQQSADIRALRDELRRPPNGR